jgi:hypothetical protein
MRLVVGILVVGAVSTVGDFLWYALGVQDRVVTGVIHGVVLLTAVGGVLGAAAGRFVAGLPLGMVAGAAGALAYYALAPAIGGSAVIAAWVALWLILALLDGKLLRRGARGAREILLRGALAAVGSGLSFYLVVGTLWGRVPSSGSDWAIQLFAWIVAWAPGLLALTVAPALRRR